jgi:hypothetical protein
MLIKPFSKINIHMFVGESFFFSGKYFKHLHHTQPVIVRKYNIGFMRERSSQQLTSESFAQGYGPSVRDPYGSDVRKTSTLDGSFLRNPATNENGRSLISISPGGFKGFYMTGIIAYLKENYDLSDFIFSGASAGAWNSILFSYQGNLTEFIQKIISDKPKIHKNESLHDFELFLKKRILIHSTSSDFDLSKVFIGAAEIRRTNMFSLKPIIFSNFIDLDDALNCCLASSHIPFITGGLFYKYKEKYTFDGGFSKYPYYSEIKPTLHITPSMWNKSADKSWYNMENYTTLLCKTKYNFMELYQQGYDDTKKNSDKLDEIFVKKYK